MLGLVGTGAALDSWARARSTAVILADVACIKPMSQHVEPAATPSKGVRSTWRGIRGRVQLQGPSLAVYWGPWRLGQYWVPPIWRHLSTDRGRGLERRWRPSPLPKDSSTCGADHLEEPPLGG